MSGFRSKLKFQFLRAHLLRPPRKTFRVNYELGEGILLSLFHKIPHFPATCDQACQKFDVLFFPTRLRQVCQV